MDGDMPRGGVSGGTPPENTKRGVSGGTPPETAEWVAQALEVVCQKRAQQSSFEARQRRLRVFWRRAQQLAWLALVGVLLAALLYQGLHLSLSLHR